MNALDILPLPQRGAASGSLRALNEGALRVQAATVEVIDAASAVCVAAYGIRVVAATDEVDVVIAIEELHAPRPIGADPRPEGRAGASEAYSIRADDDLLRLTAASAEAAFRGLVSIAGSVKDGILPRLRIEDHPAHSWRGLSLDVVRRWFPVDDITRIIDLLAVHKMNVLHLHLTDSQAWRFAVPGYPDIAAEAESYALEDLTSLEEYARERFVTIVPEIDVPGHVAGSLMHADGIDVVEGAHPFVRYLTWDGSGVADFVRAGFAVLAERFASPHLHLGGDEAFGAPHDDYARFIREAAAVVRDLGRTPIGWQEVVRSDGFGRNDLVQLWIAERDRFDLDKARTTFPEQYHPLLAQAAELFALSVDDPARIGSAGIPAIVSSSDPLYLDRRTTDASRDPAQHDVWSRLGNPGYDPTPTTSVLSWDPASQSDIAGSRVLVAGIEAALWCESVHDFDDVATLLLPRLALIAQRAWSNTADADDVIAAAAAQAAMWTRLGFHSYYRSSEVFSE